MTKSQEIQLLIDRIESELAQIGKSKAEIKAATVELYEVLTKREER